MTNFYITVNLIGNPAFPAQSNGYQMVTPWGQTDVCVPWEEVITQAFRIGSPFSGRMGAFFNLGTVNGLLTSSQLAPLSANSIKATS